MTVPNAADAVVPPEKLARYLLDVGHTVGGSKARFFRAHGFDEANADLLAEGLCAIALGGAASERESPFGVKDAVAGDLPTPRGTVVQVETVWIIESGETWPRLVTAYPVT